MEIKDFFPQHFRNLLLSECNKGFSCHETDFKTNNVSVSRLACGLAKNGTQNTWTMLECQSLAEEEIHFESARGARLHPTERTSWRRHRSTTHIWSGRWRKGNRMEILLRQMGLSLMQSSRMEGFAWLLRDGKSVNSYVTHGETAAALKVEKPEVEISISGLPKTLNVTDWQCIWPANPPGLDLWLPSHALPLPLHGHSTDPVYQINKLTSSQEADSKTLSHSWAAISDTQKNFDTGIPVSLFPPREILLLMAVESKENDCQPTIVIKYMEETEDIKSLLAHLSPTYLYPSHCTFSSKPQWKKNYKNCRNSIYSYILATPAQDIHRS